MHHITVLLKSPITLFTKKLLLKSQVPNLIPIFFLEIAIFCLKNQLNSSFQLHLKDSQGIKIALILNLRLARGKGDTNADIDTSIFEILTLIRYFEPKVSYFRYRYDIIEYTLQ